MQKEWVIMNKSVSLKNLLPALIKAQSEFPVILKTEVNPFFKSKYADLSTILEAVNPVLRKNGLVIIQTVERTVLETTLFHESDEFITSYINIDEGIKEPQKFGSAITYYRRYGIQAILNLAAEDDDGEGAKHEEMPKKPTKKEII